MSLIAAWRISERDRYPFLVAARRELYRSQAISREKFKGILDFGDAAFQSAKKPAAEIYDTGVQLVNVIDNDRQDFEAALDADSGKENISVEKEKASNFAYVSRILLELSRSDKNKAKITAAKILEDSKSPQLAGAGEDDLRNLLQWTAANLKDKNKEISTVHTYAVKVLRALFSMPQTGFADWDTADMA